MHPFRNTLIDLETRFWQSVVDQDSDTAAGLLAEPALMVSAHGAMKFDHAGYRQMAEQGALVLTSFALSQVEVVFPNDSTAVMVYHVKQGVAPRGSQASVDQHMVDSSTWVKTADQWACVLHTETPAQQSKAA